MTLVFPALAVLTVLALAAGLFRRLDKHEQALTEREPGESAARWASLDGSGPLASRADPLTRSVSVPGRETA